jgi:homoserine O-acetyltransferase
MARILEPTYEGNFTFAEEPFVLENGESLPSVTLHYAVYGELNKQRDNAILVCHALSGSARVADWWGELFNKGVFDLEKHCVIGINILGSCYGSTGPTSINPQTRKRYGAAFPVVTTRDIVRAHTKLLDYLGIEKVKTVIGGSIGGQQALQLAIDFPERVENAVVIGAAPLSALALALNHLQRLAIQNDAEWSQCPTDPHTQPTSGLALARAIAMLSYKSAELFEERFSRNPNRTGEEPLRSLHERFDVAGYLDYQGESFTRRFDANSYLIITKAMDSFDVARGYVSEIEALSRVKAKTLFVGISSDWLFPAKDVRALADKINAVGGNAVYVELISSHGHDGFLAEEDELVKIVRPFIEECFESGEKESDEITLLVENQNASVVTDKAPTKSRRALLHFRQSIESQYRLRYGRMCRLCRRMERLID